MSFAFPSGCRGFHDSWCHLLTILTLFLPRPRVTVIEFPVSANESSPLSSSDQSEESWAEILRRKESALWPGLLSWEPALLGLLKWSQQCQRTPRCDSSISPQSKLVRNSHFMWVAPICPICCSSAWSMVHDIQVLLPPHAPTSLHSSIHCDVQFTMENRKVGKPCALVFHSVYMK